jgi:uncharacterized OB-fold protein
LLRCTIVPPTAVAEGLFAVDDPPHLIGASCESCGNQHFPATDGCPYCGSRTVARCPLPTTGRLWAWTGVGSAPPGYTGPVPYGFGVVELDGRIRVVTRLTEADPSALEVGQRMRLVLVDIGSPDGAHDPDDAVLTWAFEPAES